MRVTQTENYRNLVSNIETLNEKIANLGRQLSSGKKLTQLKDSPSGSAELIALSERASEIDQYSSNTASGLYFLGTADSALNSVQNLVTDIYAKGSQAAAGTVNPDARAALASEIRSLRDQILSLANSQAQGRYIFAGSKTASVPFTIASDSVTYHGDDNANKINVDDGMEVQQGVPGSAMFVSIFSTISSLLQGLDGNNLSDIKTALDGFSSALSGLSLVRGQIGADLSQLENVKAGLESRKTDLTAHRSQVEDADLSKVVVELNQSQTALSAAISSAGSILSQRNLFDILG
jgi:flagellar hook-associated protein 3 FlgL